MSDLINRQAAIEDIRTMIPKDARFDIKWIEMWLMQLPSAQLEPQWIPVSERLPDFGVDVLVCNDEGVQVTAKRTGWSTDPDYWAINYCGYDYDSWDFATNGDIVAWMELPKPYERKEE